MKIKSKNDKKSSQTLDQTRFFPTMRKVLIACRFSGFLPVDGLQGNNFKDLRFSYNSLYFLVFTIPSILLNIFLICGVFLACLSTDSSFIKYPEISLLFYGAAASVVYLNFSRNFRKMVNIIENVENLLPPVTNHAMILRKIHYILAYFLISSLGDHIVQTSTIASFIHDCFLLPDDSGFYLKSFFIRIYGCLFRSIPFYYTVGFLLQFCKLQAVFSCNVGDALILSCSIYLENRIKHFNVHILQKNLKECSERINWSEMQAQYTAISNLTAAVDRHLSPIIFITFFTNVIIICQRLFQFLGQHNTPGDKKQDECIFNHRDFWLRKVSFNLSIFLVVSKTVAMLFLLARIHTSSREPLKALGFMPNVAYTQEAHRFMEQVHHSKVALSGFGLFKFTRETILTVCSVLITYELMLFQM